MPRHFGAHRTQQCTHRHTKREGDSNAATSMAQRMRDTLATQRIQPAHTLQHTGNLAISNTKKERDCLARIPQCRIKGLILVLTSAQHIRPFDPISVIIQVMKHSNVRVLAALSISPPPTPAVLPLPSPLAFQPGRPAQPALAGLSAQSAN